MPEVATVEPIDLSPFYCSDNFYKHWLGLIYTDGVKYVADECKAYWLLDAIASHQPRARRDPMLRDFQIWTLRKPVSADAKSMAILECFKDSDRPPTIVQNIPYTDWPFARMPADFKLYVEGKTILLPSEH